MRYWRMLVHRSAVVVLVAAVVMSTALRADTRSIEIEQSTLTVYVYKSGLFSAFADNHIIKAPIASGQITDGETPAVSLTVHAPDLRVLDPGLSASRRAEVQARMIGSEVLDAARFTDITFVSTAVTPGGSERWQVTGRLTLHGQMRSIAFPVTKMNGRYRGEVKLKQRDFGIEPITVAGGAVKVKDEIVVQFDIAA